MFLFLLLFVYIIAIYFYVILCKSIKYLYLLKLFVY